MNPGSDSATVSAVFWSASNPNLIVDLDLNLFGSKMVKFFLCRFSEGLVGPAASIF